MSKNDSSGAIIAAGWRRQTARKLLSPVLGLAFLLNGSCDDARSGDDGQLGEVRQLSLLPPAPCTTRIEGSALVTSFTVTTTVSDNSKGTAEPMAATYASSSDDASGKQVDDFSILHSSHPVLTGHIESDFNQDQPVTKMTFDFESPVIGPAHVEVLVNGETAVATIDGKKTQPYSIHAAADTVRMEDGSPLPKFKVPGQWPERLAHLSDLAKNQAATCPSVGAETTSATALGAKAGLNSFGPVQGHPGSSVLDHASKECLFKLGVCASAGAGCVYGATGAAAGCASIPVIGWFAAPVCGLGALFACYEAEKKCLRDTKRDDVCCPERCGGKASSPLCCFGGESCTDSGNLCCNAGSPPCGGTTCCEKGDTCLRREICVGTFCLEEPNCCSPDKACGTKCCADGEVCTDAATETCCPASQKCGSACCQGGTDTCADPSQSLCCGLGEELCGNTCCAFFEDCVNGACVATPPDAPDCGSGSISCTTDADCPEGCGTAACFCRLPQNSSVGCCNRIPT